MVDVEAKLDKARKIDRSNALAFDINMEHNGNLMFIHLKMYLSFLKCNKMKSKATCDHIRFVKEQSHAGLKSQPRLEQLSEDQKRDGSGSAVGFGSSSQRAFNSVNHDYANLRLIELRPNLKPCMYRVVIFPFLFFPSLSLQYSPSTH